MTKSIIGALVGAIILFFWGFASFGPLGVHKAEMDYVANQQEIMDCLEGKLPAGSYMIPQAAPGQDMAAFNQSADGKPWAWIHYRTSFNTSMTVPMIRNIVASFVAIILLIWLLQRMQLSGFLETFIAILSVSTFSYLLGTYSESAWFETSTLGDLLDTLVQSVLLAGWLNWWLARK